LETDDFDAGFLFSFAISSNIEETKNRIEVHYTLLVNAAEHNV
jgi:hypothetical protein